MTRRQPIFIQAVIDTVHWHVLEAVKGVSVQHRYHNIQAALLAKALQLHKEWVRKKWPDLHEAIREKNIMQHDQQALVHQYVNNRLANYPVNLALLSENLDDEDEDDAFVVLNYGSISPFDDAEKAQEDKPGPGSPGA